MSDKEINESDYSSSSYSSSSYSSTDESSDSEYSLCNDEKNQLENEDFDESDYEYEHVVGIDLGTSNSCVAIYRNGQVEIIPDEYGHKIITSYVAYTVTGKRYVGHDAKNQTEYQA